ncbi:MAG TPA: hypothetical protein H9811_03630 [Candidatus Gemmiger excrementigallinarum]|uniref:Uncharacterized protein n=1 Tax=Candidatus Gemmiger excrementigallinarum TaxID=2838609 RepID=A0A9D2EPR0_9FIRM|nr:hypothetical protein [Candidatus Gemmiger excrementigallinarum]
MDKDKLIAQLFALLKDASAVQCDLVLTSVEHTTGKARDDKASGKTFTLTAPDAIEIAYIVQRSQDNPQLMHKLLLYCKAFEKAYSDDDQK